MANIKEYTKELSIKAFLLGPIGLKKHASLLLYHSIGDDNSFLTLKAADLEKQLQYIQKNNYSVVKLSELFNRLRKGESVNGLVALTFDDAYENFYHNAWPLLKKYKMLVTVFVPTGLIGKSMILSNGKSFPIMTKEMILEISNEGMVEFMPHTENHPDLSTLPLNQYDKELEVSRSLLRGLVGLRSEDAILAYPKGRLDQKVADYLVSNKWKGAVGMFFGLVTKDSHPYCLARNRIGPETTFGHFRLFLSDRLELFLKIKNKLG